MEFLDTDKAAWSSTMAGTRPEVKLLASALLMTTAFFMPIWQAEFVLVGIVLILALFFTNVRTKSYLQFLGIVLLFVIPAVLPIAVSIVPVQGGLQVTLDPANIREALLVGGRTFACSCALLMYGYSTPLVDTIDLMQRLRIPATIIEMMVLTYRSIFSFLKKTQTMIDAQHLRGGYATPAKTFASSSRAFALSLSWAFARSEETSNAMVLRGGVEPTLPLPRTYAEISRNAILVLTVSAICVILAIGLRIALG